jgi:release factor glutamine methyltransferase|tara:strand:+ start:589 stop:1425 length:837 start_codon:yes stop_codon:yes gene_type:complete
MIILDLLSSGSKILKSKKVQTHQLDSEIILSSILKKKREQIIINSEEKVSKKNINNFNKLIIRRSTKEPLAYILKNKEFWSKNFFVNRDTLIPRPETELLCDIVIKLFKNKNPHILDIGTGTGCILLSILSEIIKAKGIGIDISKKAIEVAKKNSKSLELDKRAKFLTRSLDNIRNYKFDLIVSNPPYIKSSDIKNLSDDVRKFEPKIALDGGKDGLDVIKKVIYKSKTILKKLGLLALEIGNGQYYKVSQILKEQGFREQLLIKDYQDNIRCILARF